MCDLSLVNYGFILNKYHNNEYAQSIEGEYGERVLLRVPYDEGIFTYEYDRISTQIKESIGSLYLHAQQFIHTNLVERIMKLHELKNA
jgi:hypothetical protein